MAGLSNTLSNAFLLCVWSLFNSVCVSGRTVNITWTAQSVQQYTVQNPLQVNPGDTLNFICVNTYSNIFRLVSEEQYNDCDGSLAEFKSLGNCYDDDFDVAGRTVALEITENDNNLQSATVFNSNQPYYFASFSQENTLASSFDTTTVVGGECAMGLKMAIFVNPAMSTSSQPPNPSNPLNPLNPSNPSNPLNTPETGGLGSELTTMEYIIIGVVVGVITIALMIAFIVIGCLCWHRFCKTRNKEKKKILNETVSNGETGVYRKQNLSNGDSSPHQHSNGNSDKRSDSADGVGESKGKQHKGSENKTFKNGVQKPTKPEKENKKDTSQTKTTQLPPSNGVKPGRIDAERHSSSNDKKLAKNVAQQPSGKSSSQKPTKAGSVDKVGGGNKVKPKPLATDNKPSPRLSSMSAARKEDGSNAAQVKGTGGHRPTYSGVGGRKPAPSRPAPGAPNKDSVPKNSSTAQSKPTAVKVKGQSSHRTVDATVSLPVGTNAKQQNQNPTLSLNAQGVKYTAK